VDLTLTEEQRLLADSARRFLSREVGTEVVRDLEAEPEGFRRDLWKRMTALGWTSVAFTEADGGMDGGFGDLLVIAEELGRAAVSAPLYVSVALGALPLAWSSAIRARERYLAGLVDGSLIATTALLEPDGRAWWPTSGGAGGRLNGRKLFVPFAASADLLLVTTTLDGEHALVAVPTDRAGIEVRRLDAIGTEPQFEVSLDVVLSPDDVIARGSAADDVVARALDAAAVLTAGHVVGLTEGALALGVAHAKDREQFGKPIGTFQAVANRLVDVRSEVDALRLLVHRAAWALDTGSPDAGLHIAEAKAYANWTARTTVANTHQSMGAIGFTMEHDLQLYTRRLKAFEVAFGRPAVHLERVADRLGLVG